MARRARLPAFRLRRSAAFLLALGGCGGGEMYEVGAGGVVRGEVGGYEEQFGEIGELDCDALSFGERGYGWDEGGF